MKITLSLVFLLATAFSVQAINIETVPIGNSGNPADMRYLDSDHPIGVGPVANSFRIGKTEVTNAQYVEFLNKVAASDPYEVYSPNMATDTWGGIVRSGIDGTYTYAVKTPALNGTYTYDDKPVVAVNWFSALRFANWLHNGQQGPETLQDGAYTLLGDSPVPTNEYTVTRNSGARWWMPSEDEWYKAAYYDPNSEVYFDFATGTNTVPNNNLPSNDTGNSVNFYDNFYATGEEFYTMTDAGAYTLSVSPYGTLDQNGSVWEWNEALFNGGRGVRGGSFDVGFIDLQAQNWLSTIGWEDSTDVGFRVARAPEPDDDGDFNHDGLVDTADYVVWRKNGGTQDGYNTWRAHFGQANATSPPGDFNRDGTVDAADYVVWRKSDGTETGYAAWRANFGAVLPGAGSSTAYSPVPEPSTAFLLTSLVAGMPARRRRNPTSSKRTEALNDVGSAHDCSYRARILNVRCEARNATSSMILSPVELRLAQSCYKSPAIKPEAMNAATPLTGWSKQIWR